MNSPSEGNYIIEFDTAIASSSSDRTSSTFYILTESNNTNIYLLKLFYNSHNLGNNYLDRKINDSYVFLPQYFLNFKLYIERTTNTISLSIYTLNDEAILYRQKIHKSSSATTDIVKHFI